MNLSKVEYLYLENNKLTQSTTNMFQSLSSLKLINLTNNNLKFVNVDVFLTDVESMPDIISKNPGFCCYHKNNINISCDSYNCRTVLNEVNILYAS